MPTLVLHGDDDQVVPYEDAGVKSANLLKHGTLKIYKGYPHGTLTTHADVINSDLPGLREGLRLVPPPSMCRGRDPHIEAWSS